MKQLLFAFVALASLGLLVLGQTTSQPIHNEYQQQQINKFNDRLANFSVLIKSTDKEYQLAIGTKNATLMAHILKQAKDQSPLILQLSIDVTAAIVSTNFQSDLFHIIQLEMIRIQLRLQKQAFKNYALEILGYQNGVFTDFPAYHFSESLQTGLTLQENIIIPTFERLTVLRDTILLHQFNMTTSVQQTVLKSLTDLIANTTTSVTEIVRDYNVALMTLRQQERTLNMEQDFEMNIAIDLLVYLEEYLRNYKETFMRVHNIHN